MLPLSARSMPLIRLSSVLFPLPLLPNRTKKLAFNDVKVDVFQNSARFPCLSILLAEIADLNDVVFARVPFVCIKPRFS